MTAAKVEQDGAAWSVTVDGHVVARRLSNSQAWRVADKLNGEHINRSEETTDWSVGMFLKS